MKFSKLINKYKSYILLAIILLFAIICSIYNNIVEGLTDKECPNDSLIVGNPLDHDRDHGDKKRRMNKIKKNIYDIDIKNIDQRMISEHYDNVPIPENNSFECAVYLDATYAQGKNYNDIEELGSLSDCIKKNRSSIISDIKARRKKIGRRHSNNDVKIRNLEKDLKKVPNNCKKQRNNLNNYSNFITKLINYIDSGKLNGVDAPNINIH